MFLSSPLDMRSRWRSPTGEGEGAKRGETEGPERGRSSNRPLKIIPTLKEEPQMDIE